jgi:hypothetical protein
MRNEDRRGDRGSTYVSKPLSEVCTNTTLNDDANELDDVSTSVCLKQQHKTNESSKRVNEITCDASERIMHARVDVRCTHDHTMMGRGWCVCVCA